MAAWPGQSNDAPRALTAHVDTLGAMVKEIKSNGRLKLTKIGGFAWNTVEGEGCTVFASQGETVRGSILLDKASTPRVWEGGRRGACATMRTWKCAWMRKR